MGPVSVLDGSRPPTFSGRYDCSSGGGSDN